MSCKKISDVHVHFIINILGSTKYEYRSGMILKEEEKILALPFSFLLLVVGLQSTKSSSSVSGVRCFFFTIILQYDQPDIWYSTQN